MSPRQRTKVISQEFNSTTLFETQSNDGQLLNSEDIYRLKRDRNNMAVKKSREKSRQKSKETAEKMALLRAENVTLEKRIDDLSQELSELKKELLKKVTCSKSKDISISKSVSEGNNISACSSNASIHSRNSDFYGEDQHHHFQSSTDADFCGSLHFTSSLGFVPHTLEDDTPFF